MKVNRPLPTRLAAGCAAAVLTASVLTACGGGLKYQDESIKHLDQTLKTVDAQFVEDTSAATDAKTATVSSQTRCYVKRAAADSEDVEPAAYCGPIRRLATTGSWDKYALSAKVAANGDTTLALDGLESQGVSVDESELVRGDSAKPVSASSLPEPQAPEATAKDFAVLLPSQEFTEKAELTKVDPALRLDGPAARLVVTERGGMKLLPAALLLAAGQLPGGSQPGADTGDTPTPAPAEGQDGAYQVPYYRPASGQKVYVWRVTVESPIVIGPSVSTGWGSSVEGAKDASTSFSLEAGSQRLSFGAALSADGSSSWSDQKRSTFTIGCRVVQCADMTNAQYVLLASVDESASPRLVMSADGQDQIVSLGDAKLSSEVSTVAYERDRLEQATSINWGSKTYTIAKEDSDDQIYTDVTYTYGGDVPAVYLAPFEASLGWAKAGRAWLVVARQNDPQRLDGIYLGSDSLAIDAKASYRLTYGKSTVSAVDREFVDQRIVFDVPDSFTKGTVTYRPKGSVTISDSRRVFQTKDALTVAVDIPK